MLSFFFILSCSKEYQEEINLQDASIEVRTNKDYVEKACIVNGKAGILCDRAATVTGCDDAASCEAVDEMVNNINEHFSTYEINNWLETDYRSNQGFMDEMYSNGYLNEPNGFLTIPE